jgi:IPT/TIG domain
LSIGATGYSGESFSGALDEARVSNVARSPDWIAAEYNTETNPSTFYTVGAATPPPQLTSLSPTSGSAGTSITLSGTHFGSSQGSSTVTFSGVIASPTSWSDTQIVAPVPGGAVTGNVVVNVSGLTSNGLTFTDTSTSITSLSPSSGPISTSVTILGANFGSTQGSSTVTFDGTTATPTSWSNTQIVVPVPSGTTSGDVVVTSGSGASNGVSFTVTIPTISSLSPTLGPTGTSVTISGSSFGLTQSQGSSTVTFNGATATPTSWSYTSIVVPVPAAATNGNAVVTVGGVASNGASFSVVPNIASFAPPNGIAGTAITVSGTGFGSTQGTSTITFNGTTATPASWSDTSIVVAVPAGATSGNVVVTVASLASNAAYFSVLPGGWIDQDVGTVGLTGSATYSNGIFTVKGAGTDIYGTADGMNFAYQQLSGDGTIIARVASFQGGSSYPKAGVMIRETLTAGSTNAYSFMQGSGPFTSVIGPQPAEARRTLA